MGPASKILESSDLNFLIFKKKKIRTNMYTKSSGQLLVKITLLCFYLQYYTLRSKCISFFFYLTKKMYKYVHSVGYIGKKKTSVHRCNIDIRHDITTFLVSNHLTRRLELPFSWTKLAESRNSFETSCHLKSQITYLPCYAKRMVYDFIIK